ncbi:DUF6770 family protein [Paraflavitalea sp. CAU 1676]|uniref:DUF6770 family protein n=1 Tax=Paraflavitalea sp. CAU 1676 TaxID=3032598 RepID=UPI0023DBCA87|nr:DUF6770 family protein [Paraflavitalea sp. CAU 1676]MDF2188205.1 hypothetical protein [Paraflavitalea sp. CAU 1676]
MIKKLLIAALCFGSAGHTLYAQQKLSIDKVYSTYLRNSGTIMENNQIRGYFFLYQSDKIDRRTNEYTLQILDENLNKVKDIKFQDSKNILLLEAAYNGATLAFLFKNTDSKVLEMKLYTLDGKLKYSYTREYDSRTDDLMKQYETLRTDEGTNQNVFDLGEQGYASVLPLRDGKQRTYEVDFYSATNKKQWTYVPTDDEERYAQAEFLGSTDSLIVLEVMKKRRMLSGKVGASLIGINFVTKKKEFEIEETEDNEYKFLPTSVIKLPGTGKMVVMGSYFPGNANIAKDASLGLAIYEVDGKGKIINKTYNSWGGDFAKYLPTNSKGKIDDVGFLFIHKLIKAPNGKLYVVGEGYKRKASALGIGLTVLAGGRSTAGVTKIVITDMVLMEFNEKYKVSNAKIYEKQQNDAMLSNISDYNSQHAIAMYLKMWGSFDYEFTTAEQDNSAFTICYSDWVRSSEYKGQTFNAIRFNGTKFSTDKIELKSKASNMKVFPAKAGSVMILEYFKKDKRMDLRLEKLG